MRSVTRTLRRGAAVAMLAVLAAAPMGCDSGPPLAPVSGHVTLDGQPLGFGYVVLQPAVGRPSRGEIGADGVFRVATPDQEPGVVIGPCRVSVYCYEGQSPQASSQQPAGDVSLGRSLIPVAYTRGGTSGLSIEVPPEGVEDFTIELSSKGPGR